MKANLTPEQRDRVAKLLALTRQGVGGEAKNAEAMLTKLLAQHGLTIDDVARDEHPKVECTVKYNHPYEKKLFTQVVYAVFDGKDWDLRRYNGTRTLTLQCSPAQRAEILVKYELYLRAFKAEIDVLMEAFIQRNRIFAMSPSERVERKEMTERDYKAMKLAQGLDVVQVNAQVEDKRGKKT